MGLPENIVRVKLAREDYTKLHQSSLRIGDTVNPFLMYCFIYLGVDNKAIDEVHESRKTT